MPKLFISWNRIVGIVLVSGMLLLPSLGFAESLKDGIIMRDNAEVFLKDGSVVKCQRIVWLVSAADFIQCDQGDHAVEIKLEDLNFEKTFGPELAREYAAMKGELADAHEESRQKQEANKVVYETQQEQEPSRPVQKEQELGQPAAAPQKVATVSDTKPTPVDVWTLEPGASVGWITLGTDYQKIVDSLGKTIMESPLPPDGKHQRYGQYGIEFWYKNDKVVTIRVGTSTPKEYSINKYKIKGVGIGSDVNALVSALGKPDHITESKYNSTHKYVYKNGILFTKYKSRDTFDTITIFPRAQYDYYSKQ